MSIPAYIIVPTITNSRNRPSIIINKIAYPISLSIVSIIILAEFVGEFLFEYVDCPEECYKDS